MWSWLPSTLLQQCPETTSMTSLSLDHHNAPWKFKTTDLLLHSVSSFLYQNLWGWGLTWSSAPNDKMLSTPILLCWIWLTLFIDIHLSICSSSHKCCCKERQRRSMTPGFKWTEIPFGLKDTLQLWSMLSDKDICHEGFFQMRDSGYSHTVREAFFPPPAFSGSDLCKTQWERGMLALRRW